MLAPYPKECTKPTSLFARFSEAHLRLQSPRPSKAFVTKFQSKAESWLLSILWPNKIHSLQYIPRERA